MNCPVCGNEMLAQKETMHHGENAFKKCSNESCEYGDHWHRVKDIRELELLKAQDEGCL